MSVNQQPVRVRLPRPGLNEREPDLNDREPAACEGQAAQAGLDLNEREPDLNEHEPAASEGQGQPEAPALRVSSDQPAVPRRIGRSASESSESFGVQVQEVVQRTAYRPPLNGRWSARRVPGGCTGTVTGSRRGGTLAGRDPGPEPLRLQCHYYAVTGSARPCQIRV